MGLGVWVARNDRGRTVNGRTFAALANMVTELPVQFDDVTRRTVEMIDILWLRGSAIVAAFEIEEHHINLFRITPYVRSCSHATESSHAIIIVAPDDRRDKVKEEISRPLFEAIYSTFRFVPLHSILGTSQQC